MGSCVCVLENRFLLQPSLPGVADGNHQVFLVNPHPLPAQKEQLWQTDTSRFSPRVRYMAKLSSETWSKKNYRLSLKHYSTALFSVEPSRIPVTNLRILPSQNPSFNLGSCLVSLCTISHLVNTSTLTRFPAATTLLASLPQPILHLQEKERNSHSFLATNWILSKISLTCFLDAHRGFLRAHHRQQSWTFSIPQSRTQLNLPKLFFSRQAPDPGVPFPVPPKTTLFVYNKNTYLFETNPLPPASGVLLNLSLKTETCETANVNHFYHSYIFTYVHMLKVVSYIVATAVLNFRLLIW